MKKLKVIGRQVFSFLVKPFVLFNVLDNLLEVFYQEHRVNKIIYTQQKVYKKLENEFNDSMVKYGYFQGMKYPKLEGVGSELFPKLLGCYEIELNVWLERIQSNDYDKIINIGCAEGYYAVGLGRMFPRSTVYAYDLVERARVLCKAMGDKNGLGNRLQVFSKCTVNTLKEIDFGKHSLIVCDCEGFEIELFKKDLITNIVNCDILIELHDFINPKISKTVLPLFEKTHDLEIYRSIDDNFKIIQLGEKYEELKLLTTYEKKIALGELRPTTMEWAFLTPKKNDTEKDSLLMLSRDKIEL